MAADDRSRTILWHIAREAADEAQEALRVATREMVGHHQRWQTFTMNMKYKTFTTGSNEQHAQYLWDKFTDASDAWSAAMATFRMKRRREENLRP